MAKKDVVGGMVEAKAIHVTNNAEASYGRMKT
jgi:hypothetical protein